MAIEIPQNYPHGMRRKAISELVKSCNAEATEQSRTSARLELASYFSQMGQLGLSELERRNQRMSTIMNWILNFITIALAICTLFLGITTHRLSKDLRKQNTGQKSAEIGLLEEQNEILIEIRESMDSLFCKLRDNEFVLSSLARDLTDIESSIEILSKGPQ